MARRGNGESDDSGPAANFTAGEYNLLFADSFRLSELLGGKSCGPRGRAVRAR